MLRLNVCRMASAPNRCSRWEHFIKQAFSVQSGELEGPRTTQFDDENPRIVVWKGVQLVRMRPNTILAVFISGEDAVIHFLVLLGQHRVDPFHELLSRPRHGSDITLSHGNHVLPTCVVVFAVPFSDVRLKPDFMPIDRVSAVF